MERRMAVFLWALLAATVAALLLPESRLDIDVLVVILGAGVAATVLRGYGGQYLLLCLGEAFAIGLGSASLVLGVLFQPVIAGMLCDDDRASLIIAGSTTLMAAAGVLIFRQPLLLLLTLLIASMGMAAGLLGFDAWIRHRFSSGDLV
jgi:hypothetical protein